MKRVKGTVLHVPVVHGSHAQYLKDRGTEERSHTWTVYLRPLELVDISHFIHHVDFILHESFSPQTRRVTEMPYEVSEYGWGEFDVIIRVFFQDPLEKPVDFYHPLGLFAENSPGEPSDKPVIREYYDEIVFQDPSEKLLQILKTTPHGPKVQSKPSTFAPFFKDFSNAESTDLGKIDIARKRLREETFKKQERYEQLEPERAALVREINSRGGRIP
eukprot:GFKZ01009645.1.p2 GENE.GFKZ01009645.1~~GFKZ01009645.1.p2  ORF type:complete len:217 (-),score=21.36 GFKZ01009645.1:2423-3073(-)